CISYSASYTNFYIFSDHFAASLTHMQFKRSLFYRTTIATLLIALPTLSLKTQQENPEDYVQEIPGTSIKFSMVGIPSGEFTMGSPETEKGRQDDEGPQH